MLLETGSLESLDSGASLRGIGRPSDLRTNSESNSLVDILFNAATSTVISGQIMCHLFEPRGVNWVPAFHGS